VRLGGIVRSVALAAAAAVALAGLVVADSFVRAPEAGAVSFLNRWDGVFSKDQLWYRTNLDGQI
jgi:hypothetical protein